MNKYIKTLISYENKEIFELPKLKNDSKIDLIKYKVGIKYRYPLLNKSFEEYRGYNKLFLNYVKNKAPDYFFTILELNRNGIHLSNMYTKITGWYLEESVYEELDDLIIIFYINKNNEAIIDKKINDLYNKFQIKNINVVKKPTFINIYNIALNGVLFITQDPFDLSKKLYIYVYGICKENNSFISYISQFYNTQIKFTKAYKVYYSYFTNNINYFPTLLPSNNLDNSGTIYGYNNFTFIDKTHIEIGELNYEWNWLNMVNLYELPNHKEIYLKKIRYKTYTILLCEEYGCFSINHKYRFIEEAPNELFFIVKEDIFIKNELGIKVLKSNLKFKPLKYREREKYSFL